MKKITETDLSKRVNALREKLVLENNSAVDEAWYDPSSWGKAEYQPTTAVQAKKSQRNYAMALQQIKDLYNKAEVSYPPKDDIVRQRYGLPPELPPFDQWDGKMPNAEQADYLTRNLFGRGASADAATQNTANQSASQKQKAHDDLVDSKVAALKVVADKLLSMIGSRDSTTGAGVVPANLPLAESMRRFARMLVEADEITAKKVTLPADGSTPNVVTQNGVTQNAPIDNKAELIKQIQALMTEINGLEENPEADVIEALKTAQSALDQAAKTTDGEAATTAPDGTAAAVATSVPAVPPAEVRPLAAAQAADAANPTDARLAAGTQTAPSSPGTVPAPAAPTADSATKVSAPAEPYTVKPGDNLTRIAKQMGVTLQDLLNANPQFQANGRNINLIYPGEKVNPPAATSPAAPAAPTPPSPPKELGNYTAKKVPQYMTNPPKDIPQADRARLGIKEAVSYADDQTLARIVSLSRR